LCVIGFSAAAAITAPTTTLAIGRQRGGAIRAPAAGAGCPSKEEVGRVIGAR
jgi:hypothetical protein